MARMLKGLAVLITGASSGIGRSTALALAERGAYLALVARHIQRLDEVVTKIKTGGGTAISFPADVTIPGSMDATDSLFLFCSPPKSQIGRGSRREQPLHPGDLYRFARAVLAELNDRWGKSHLLLGASPGLAASFGVLLRPSGPWSLRRLA